MEQIFLLKLRLLNQLLYGDILSIILCQIHQGFVAVLL